MHLRRFQLGDESALFDVYFSAIHKIAIRDYTTDQVNAWAPKNVDQDLWNMRVQGINPFVVELAGKIVGYADLQSNGYIDHFFVSGHHPRQGIGAALMLKIHNVAEDSGVLQLTSDVSRTAEPFFRRFGFAVAERREPVIRGVTVPNAFMRKALGPSAREA